MKKLIPILIVLIAVAGILYAVKAHAAMQAQATAKVPPPPGVEIAKTLSVVTGVAISPLLGVSAVGCYQYYFKAKTDEERAKLPWFASPLFWLAGVFCARRLFRQGHRRRGTAHCRQKTVRRH